MKRLLYLCTLVTVAALSLAAAVQTDTPVGLNSRAAELERLNTALRAAKDAGQPADPAMLARAREVETALQQNVVTTPTVGQATVPAHPERLLHGVMNQVDVSPLPANG